jgi:hypothetical protein
MCQALAQECVMANGILGMVNRMAQALCDHDGGTCVSAGGLAVLQAISTSSAT